MSDPMDLVRAYGMSVEEAAANWVRAAEAIAAAVRAEGEDEPVSDVVEFVAWLREQLDEDERAILDRWDSDGRARVATMWTGGEPGYTTVASDQGDGVWVADGREVTDARHVLVLFDPARVLAEVAAKKAILDLYRQAWGEHQSWLEDVGGDTFGRADEIRGRVESLHETIRLLAQPYAGRPGWREEWAT
jgi:hypothetical protein